MTTRKLEEIASNLEDMSETIEEIKTETVTRPDLSEKLDTLQTEMTRAADRIDESLEGLDIGSPVPTGPDSQD